MFAQENTTGGGLLSTIGTCSLVFCSAFFISFALGAFIHKKNITLLGKRKRDFRLSGDSVLYHHPGIDFEETWRYDDDDYVGRESYEKDKIKEMAVFENTPSGDVYMEYDKEYDVFHYWSDRSINYSFLSTLARKYNIVFDLVAAEGGDGGAAEGGDKGAAEGEAGGEVEGAQGDDCSSDSDDFLFVKPKRENTAGGKGVGTGGESEADRGEAGKGTGEAGRRTGKETADVPLYRFIRKGSIEDYIFKQTVCDYDDDDDEDAPLAMSYADFLKNHGC